MATGFRPALRVRARDHGPLRCRAGRATSPRASSGAPQAVDRLGPAWPRAGPLPVFRGHRGPTPVRLACPARPRARREERSIQPTVARLFRRLDSASRRRAALAVGRTHRRQTHSRGSPRRRARAALEQRKTRDQRQLRVVRATRAAADSRRNRPRRALAGRQGGAVRAARPSRSALAEEPSEHRRRGSPPRHSRLPARHRRHPARAHDPRRASRLRQQPRGGARPRACG